ncbi:MAG: nicotinate-nucleotide adenylyltransferase [Kiritimatiellia bacterium]|nr:nicotinate-nucleotide adenylyltransferase [Lentisphaerota bacterium]
MLKRRMGIFGGTFNPLHLGHLVAAQDASEHFELSRVLFVPCDRPPHKPSHNLAPSAHRVAMLEAALEGSHVFEVCDLEVRRGGTNYSFDTVRELKRLYPDQELVFIIGSDTLFELHSWHAIADLLQLCEFTTLVRPGFDVSEAAGRVKLPPPWPERLLARLAMGHLMNISSSDIRYRVAEGMSIQYLVPRVVETYITEHRLYNNTI